MKSVRFVSLTDQFDTVNGLTDQSTPKRSQIRIPLTNAFNEQVAVDIKNKTAFAMDMKVQRGIFIGPRAPFGYQKTKEEFDQIIPDSEAAAHLSDSSQNTEKILKGKVICGCCGGKMQCKCGTIHADWYFFTFNTNNRLEAGKCTGMYVREEDIFSTIYYQLKLYI